MGRASRWLLASFLSTALFLPAAVGAADDHTVGIGDDCGSAPIETVCFFPTPLTIGAGDRVTFFIYYSSTFHGPHNVVADDGSFRCAAGCDGEGGDGSPRGQSGFGSFNPALQWSFTRTFSTPGTVAYHDEVSGAAGVIIVQSVPQVQTAVEYIYGQPWDYGYVSSYFVTSAPGEIALLDGGAFGGLWRRTGETFNVWSEPMGAASPTCRFFHEASGAHVYAPHADECAALRAGPGRRSWTYEGIVFHLQLPDADGACPTGTTTLYRLYNNGVHPPPFYPVTGSGAPLHRLTTSVATLNRMRAAGWTVEGHGVTFAFACVPVSQGSSGP